MTGSKNFSIYLFASVFTAFLGFCTAIYLAKILTPEEYGYIGLFVLAIFLVEPLMSLCAVGLMEIRYVNSCPSEYLKYRSLYAGQVTLLWGGSLLGAVLLSFIIPDLIILLLAVPCVAFVRVLNKLVQVELVQDKRASTVANTSIAASIFSLVLTVFLVQFMVGSWGGRLLAIFFGELVVIIFVLKYVKPVNICRPTMESIKENIKFGFPLMVAVAASWLMNESDKVVVLKFLTLSDLGVYTLAYTVGRSVDLVSISYIKAIRPAIYAKMKSGLLTLRELNKYVGGLLLVLSVVAVPLFFVVRYMGKRYLDSSYIEGIEVLGWVMASFVVFGGYRVCSLVFEYNKLNSPKTVVFYIAAFFNVALSLFLVGKFGLIGPAVGTMLGFLALLIVSYYYVVYVKSGLVLNGS